MATEKRTGQLRMESWPLSKLKPAAYNPRVKLKPKDEEYQKILRSINELGYSSPIIVNADGTVISGHQRLAVMKDLGYTEASVVVLELDKQKEKALNVALNKIDGRWDEKKLGDLLLDLDLNSYDFTVTGFTRAEADDLLKGLKLDEDDIQADESFDGSAAYEEIAEPVTKLGDIYILGNHRLMCGDSTDPEDVAELMAGTQADLVITDPPYNVDYEEKVEALIGSGHSNTNRDTSRIANDSMEESEFYDFLLQTFENLKEATRPGGVIYVFHADSKGLTFRQAFQDAGLTLRQVLIWEKNTFVLGRQDYQWRHEPILYGWKDGAGHYFVKERNHDTVLLDDDIDFEAMNKQELLAYIYERRKAYQDLTTVLFENKPVRSDLHPTMKPVQLIGRLMRNSSVGGATVLDLFGGSGSTLMAAEQLGRRCCTMEMDPKYCDVIIRRWEEYTGEKAELVRREAPDA